MSMVTISEEHLILLQMQQEAAFRILSRVIEGFTPTNPEGTEGTLKLSAVDAAAIAHIQRGLRAQAQSAAAPHN